MPVTVRTPVPPSREFARDRDHKAGASWPTALVLALHGGGGLADRLDGLTNGQFQREADRRGWIVVFPQGVKLGWNDGRPVNDNPRKDVDDVAFLSALIDRLASDYAVDTKRVYATGISNGGMMSILLAMRLSDRIAAVAPVTANVGKTKRGSR
ncbi:MAG: PHB depolymerase family esterase [Myxococcota bacterium]